MTIHELQSEAEEDAFLNAIQKGKGKEWQPFTEDNWREEMNRIPLFMNELNFKEDNPQLEAIQQLVYDGTPEEIALNFKNQGNELLMSKQRKYYKDAIKYYTRGLDQKCSDQKLNTQLLINRAQANLLLSNYKSCLMDCKKALEMTDDESLRAKAFYRASKAYFHLEHYSEALTCLQHGRILLKSEQNSEIKVFEELKVMIEKEKFEYEKKQRAKEEKKLQKEKERQSFFELLYQRRIKYNRKSMERVLFNLSSESAEEDEEEMVISQHISSLIFPLPTDLKNSFEMLTNELILPMLFIYPELSTFDFIQQAHESEKLKTMLQMCLSEQRPDIPLTYQKIENLSCYVAQEGKWTKVRVLGTVLDVLISAGLAEDGVIRVWILRKQDQCPFTKTFLEQKPKLE